MVFKIGKFSLMEISIVERYVWRYIFPPFSLFIVVLEKVKVLIKVRNFDINVKRDGYDNIRGWLNSRIKEREKKRDCVCVFTS